MSQDLNKAMIIGRLGQDPEVRYMPDNSAVANISVATSETWKDKQTGEQKERTEWHRVTIFGKLAEIVGEYLKKGSQVYIEGQLRTRKWQDQSGQDRYTTEIIVNNMAGGGIQMLGNPQGANNTTNDPQPAPESAEKSPKKPKKVSSKSTPVLDDDGIPPEWEQGNK